MLSAVLLFIVGLILLIRGGDWFVDGACGIAHRFHLPEVLIGATVVSIGTTFPEVMVSATSALSGHSEIAYGNAIGSVICNTALIAAVTITVRPQRINRRELTLPICFFFVSAVFFAGTAYTSGSFTRAGGIVFLLIFLIYMICSVRNMSKDTSSLRQDTESARTYQNSQFRDFLFLIAGAVLIAVGANLLVDNGTLIAVALNVPESVIALTFVALGTSLPELVTAITSLIKGHNSLSLGNVIGANLFNLVLVCGISITLQPFSIPSESTLFGINASLLIDLPVMFAVMMILAIPALTRQRLYRVQGIALILIYFAYCIIQFVM